VEIPTGIANIGVYVQGKSKCLECAFDISLELNDNKPEIVRSCNIAPDESVIMSNMVSAGLMTGELPFVFEDNEHMRHKIGYNSSNPMNWIYGSKDDPCDCHEKEELPYLNKLKLDRELKIKQFGRGVLN